MLPPIAKKEPSVLRIHGYELTDNYSWMRDRAAAKNPAIIDHLTLENSYTETYMGPHKPFEDSLYNEMLGRIKQTDLSVPYRLGDYWYFSKTEEGKQYPTFLRSLTRDGSDAVVLLDQNEMAAGHEYFSVSLFEPSDDGNLLAFATDVTGYREYTLHIKDLSTGEILPDRIERVTSVEWSSDGKFLFYSLEDAVSKRTDKILRHFIGGDREDELVFHEADILFGAWIERSRDQQMYFICSYAKTMREYWYLSANDPDGEFKLITKRSEGHEYTADFDDGRFYFVTNRNAENFKVTQAPFDNPGEDNWTDFIPHDPAVKIDAIDFFKGHAVVSELENGLEYLRVIDLTTGRPPERIPTPESVYTLELDTNPEYEIDAVRYRYASMITPNSTFEYDFDRRESTLLKQQEIPSGYDKTQYVTERVWATARDGVRVPISLMMKKGTVLDGKSPMLLYAYGSYGISITPNFSTARLSLVDRGMIYAIAHIRGGGELGEPWRQAGRMYKKLNTFHDFIDAANWLAESKYTSNDRLVIQGGSAGGLLVGAVVNMSPGTFHAAIAQVPFVDVINTMLDETLPLTTEEWIEWGNPKEKEAWDYMVQYSPYENVRAQDYPNMLLEASLNDSQVPYWEAAKLTARIRESKTNDSVILLKTNLEAGHGGASGRYDRLKEIAFTYAYALTQVGITN